MCVELLSKFHVFYSQAHEGVEPVKAEPVSKSDGAVDAKEDWTFGPEKKNTNKQTLVYKRTQLFSLYCILNCKAGFNSYVFDQLVNTWHTNLKTWSDESVSHSFEAYVDSSHVLYYVQGNGSSFYIGGGDRTRRVLMLWTMEMFKKKI